MLMVADLQTGEQRELYTHGDPRDDSQEGGPYYVDGVELSPDGQWVYFSTCCEPAVGTTYRIPVAGGEPVVLRQGAYPRISPDGRHLATSGCQFVFVPPADGGEGRRSRSTMRGPPGLVARRPPARRDDLGRSRAHPAGAPLRLGRVGAHARPTPASRTTPGSFVRGARTGCSTSCRVVRSTTTAR